MANTDAPWSEADVPAQTGRTFLVTGANSGLGLESSRVLAQRGARVLMACRDATRGEKAAETVRAAAPEASVEVVSLDLSSLASVRATASALRGKLTALDGLLNNAGVMAPPYTKTVDGFELQLGTNHLGHFALTLALWPLLAATPGSRVVNVSSLYHKPGRIDLDDPFWERRSYDPWSAYAQSKLANLLFTFELAARAEARGDKVVVTSAHPGYSDTNLQARTAETNPGILASVMASVGNKLFAQSQDKGAVPQLRALTDPTAQPGEFFGPAGLTQMGGKATRVKAMAKAYDPAVARGLWELSERVTGSTLPAAS